MKRLKTSSWADLTRPLTASRSSLLDAASSLIVASSRHDPKTAGSVMGSSQSAESRLASRRSNMRSQWLPLRSWTMGARCARTSTSDACASIGMRSSLLSHRPIDWRRKTERC